MKRAIILTVFAIIAAFVIGCSNNPVNNVPVEPSQKYVTLAINGTALLDSARTVSQTHIIDSVNIAYPNRGPIVFHRTLDESIREYSRELIDDNMYVCIKLTFNETFEQFVTVNCDTTALRQIVVDEIASTDEMSPNEKMLTIQLHAATKTVKYVYHSRTQVEILASTFPEGNHLSFSFSWAPPWQVGLAVIGTEETFNWE